MSASKPSDARFMPESSQGFILLEVLVAMSMILGIWMASVATYQRLALSLVQQEAKRSQLRKEFDAFEIQEQGRANYNLPGKDISREPARMPSRHRSMRTTTKPSITNKR